MNTAPRILIAAIVVAAAWWSATTFREHRTRTDHEARPRPTASEDATADTSRRARATAIANTGDGEQRPNSAARWTRPPRRTVHRAAHFVGARFGDLTVGDGLRLLAARSHATDGAVRAGSYVSPIDDAPLSAQEQMNATFDRIQVSVDADVPAGAEVRVELRAIAYDEDGEGWSDWREVRRNEVVTFAALAQKWQYRVTLTASDATSEPVVHAVTVITERDPALAAKAFAFVEADER